MGRTLGMSRIKGLALFVLLVVAPQWGEASVKRLSSDKFSDVVTPIFEFSSTNYQPNVGETPRQLAVFDIDETLLITPNCLGTEITGLVDWTRKVLQCPSTLAEDQIADLVQEIQRAQVDTIALTARGSDLVPATHRELLRNQIFLKDHPFSHAQNFGPGEIPGMRAEFKDGVLFAQGENKGKVLRAFLAHMNLSYSQIVFVDDNARNIADVAREFEKDANTKAIVFHYTKHSRPHH